MGGQVDVVEWLWPSRRDDNRVVSATFPGKNGCCGNNFCTRCWVHSW